MSNGKLKHGDRHILSAPVLIGIAKEAAKRTEGATSDNSPGQNDALVAILFSAATIEALLMELGFHAAQQVKIFGKFESLRESMRIPQLQAFTDLMAEIEVSKGSIRSKLLMAKYILSGESYDKGASPYQDFDLLFRCRDAIIHLKPERVVQDETEKTRTDKIVRLLDAKGLCAEGLKESSSWLQRIATRAISRWSCNVVADVVESLRNCLPIVSHDVSFFQRTLWAPCFNPVDAQKAYIWRGHPQLISGDPRPWFDIRNGQLYPDYGHPDRSRDRPQFRIRNGNVLPDVGHPDGASELVWFVIRENELYPGDEHPGGPSDIPWYRILSHPLY